MVREPAQPDPLSGSPPRDDLSWAGHLLAADLGGAELADPGCYRRLLLDADRGVSGAHGGIRRRTARSHAVLSHGRPDLHSDPADPDPPGRTFRRPAQPLGGGDRAGHLQLAVSGPAGAGRRAQHARARIRQRRLVQWRGSVAHPGAPYLSIYRRLVSRELREHRAGGGRHRIGARGHRPVQRHTGDGRDDDLLGARVPSPARRALRLDRCAGHRHRRSLHRALSAVVRARHAVSGPEDEHMIEVKDVVLGYGSRAFITAVDGATMSVGHNEIVGIAGESGSGKSTLIRAMYGDFSTGLRMTSGRITATFPGREPVDCHDMRKTWWSDISYVPQGSMSVLNPL